MPDMRLLLDLQILDQELMSAFNRLGLIDDALEDRHELIQLENRIAENKRFNEKMTVEHKDLELKSMSLKEKANKVRLKQPVGIEEHLPPPTDVKNITEIKTKDCDWCYHGEGITPGQWHLESRWASSP